MINKVEGDTANHHRTDASDPESQRIESFNRILDGGMMALPTENTDCETVRDSDIISVGDARTALSSGTSLESRPGAYRMPGRDHADEVTYSSDIVEQEQQEHQAIQAIGLLDSDLDALVDAEAARVLQQEREEQPVIEAVTQVDNAGQDEPSGQESIEYKVFGLPKWCIKWLFLGTLMVVLVVSIYFVTRSKLPTTAPSAAPTMAAIAKDPIIAMFDLLRDYVPDIAMASSQPNSTEHRAVEWLARNNYTSSVAQGFAMVVLYLETGGGTGNWNIDNRWLSEEPICDWYGVGCNGANITTLNLGRRKSHWQRSTIPLGRISDPLFVIDFFP
jgi:hypothetical protein